MSMNLPDLVARLRVQPDAGAGRAGEEFVDGFEGAAAPKAKGMGGRLGRVIDVAFGNVIAQGALRAADAVGSFFTGSVGAASNLEESINAVRVAYGENADAILALSDSASGRLGSTSAEFNSAAVRFSAFASTIAGDSGDVAGTLDTITTRATDFASVFNLDVAEAQQVFQSGLAGETEPLRKFGIDLSAATVEAYAYAQGIAESGKPLTEQQKVQARYGALLEQTSKVQGDFANTSDGFANASRRAKAALGEVQAEVGARVLPILATLAATVADNLLPAFDRVDPILDRIGDGFGVVAGIVGPFVSDVGERLVGLFTDAGSAGDGFAGTLDSIVGPASSLRDTLVDAGGRISEALLPVVDALSGALSEGLVPFLILVAGIVVGTLLPAILGWYEQIAGFLVPIIETVASVLVETVIPAALGFARTVQEALVKVQPFIEFLTRVISIALSVATTILGALIPPLVRFAGPIIGAVISVLGALIGVIGNVLGWVGRFGNSILDAAEQPERFRAAVKSKFDEAVAFVRGIPGRISSALGNLGSRLKGAGSDLIQGFIQGIKDSLGGAISALLRGLDDLVAAGKRRLGIASPSKVFRGMGRDTGKGYTLGVEDEIAGAARAAERLVAPPSASRLAVAPRSAVLSGAAVPSPVEVRLIVEDGAVRDLIRVEVDDRERVTVRKVAARSAR